MPMAPERTRHPHPAVHQQIQLVDEGALGQVAVPVQVDAVRTVQFGPSAARFRTPSPVRSVCTLPCAPVFRAGVPRCLATTKSTATRSGGQPARPRTPASNAPAAAPRGRGRSGRPAGPRRRRCVGRRSTRLLRRAAHHRSDLRARWTGVPGRATIGAPAPAGTPGPRALAPLGAVNARHARRGPVDGPVEAHRLLVQRRSVDVELQQRGTGPSGCRKSTGEPGGDTRTADRYCRRTG